MPKGLMLLPFAAVLFALLSESLAIGQITPSPTPAPARSANAEPACSRPNADVTVTEAREPNYPASELHRNLGPVSVLVLVTVESSGAISDATIYKSSNNKAIDEAALVAARKSTYSPKVADCQPTRGQGLYLANFTVPAAENECVDAKVQAHEVLLETQGAEAALKSGHSLEAFTLFKRAAAQSNVARFEQCDAPSVKSKVELGIAQLGYVIGVLAFQEHQDAQDKCERMHWESARFYLAQAWAALSAVELLDRTSKMLSGERARVYRDLEVLARRVRVTPPPITSSDEVSTFLSKFGMLDVSGCDLRFQPRTNWFG